MDSDAENFYDHQRSIGTAYGILLPSWDQLCWAERSAWEDRLNEQIQRDKEYDHTAH